LHVSDVLDETLTLVAGGNPVTPVTPKVTAVFPTTKLVPVIVTVVPPPPLIGEIDA
jgi:hypothetical protein